jgi:hypothetical protein
LTKPPLPVVRRLEISDLVRIEGWSMQGLAMENIAVLLGLSSPAAFHALAEQDPRINASLLHGRNRGIELVSKALFGAATSGKDSSASKWYLERLGPLEFRPPRGAPIVIVEAARPDPDREAEHITRIGRMAERQRLLVSGRDFDAEGNIIDLVPDPVRKKSPSGNAEGGELASQEEEER